MTKTQYLAPARGPKNATNGVKWLCALSILACSSTVQAQTWAGNRQRPSLREIATVDQTGEPNWLWGREDVAGNGLNQFPVEEQAIDARSVYLRVEGGRLWWRTYVSATVAPENNLTAYLFIDNDLNVNSGRSAAATEIDAAFVDDPSAGGYEYVFAVRGDGTLPQLWELNVLGTAFVEAVTSANELDAEANVIVDPLRVGQDARGYVQASIVDYLVAITAQCQARFYVRTTNQTQALGAGDLDVGEAVYCTPTDVNLNQVPDLIEPVAAVAECQTNAQCPNGGICWNGRCWLAPVCTDDLDCAPTATCINGSCIVTGGADCRFNGDCATGLCENGQCVVCTTDSDCGTGRVCAPDGRCVNENAAGPAAGGTGNTSGNNAGTSGIVLAAGERIQGGACACRVGSMATHRDRAGWMVMLAGLFIRRLRRRRAERGQAR